MAESSLPCSPPFLSVSAMSHAFPPGRYGRGCCRGFRGMRGGVARGRGCLMICLCNIRFQFLRVCVFELESDGVKTTKNHGLNFTGLVGRRGTGREVGRGGAGSDAKSFACMHQLGINERPEYIMLQRGKARGKKKKGGWVEIDFWRAEGPPHQPAGALDACEGGQGAQAGTFPPFFLLWVHVLFRF